MGALTAAAGPLAVTGAAGALGRAVVAAAVAAGWRVRAITRSADAPPCWRDAPGVEHAVVDLGDAQACAGALAPALADAAAVIHLAAAMRGDDARHARDTIGATRHVLAAMPAAARFVLASSISVYNFASMPDGAQLDELSALEPAPERRDAYARAKLAQDALVRAAARDGLDARILRIGALTAPGARWTAMLGVRAGPLLLRPHGDAALPVIETSRCAELALRAAIAARPPLIVNVVSDSPPSRDAYIAQVRDELALRAILPLPGVALKAAAFGGDALGVAAPGLLTALPALARPEAAAARFKPLRYNVARLRQLESDS